MLVLTTSTSVTKDSEEAIFVNATGLEQITYIRYPIAFLNGVTQDGSVLDPVLAIFDSRSEVNAMHLNFIKRLGLVVQATNVGAQKIDGITFETYKMVVAILSIID